MKRWLTSCAGATFIALIAAAGLFLIGVPALVQYLARYDRQPLFDLHGLGERQSIGSYEVILSDVTALDCGINETCQQAIVSFEVVMYGADANSVTSYRISWQAASKTSNMISLSDGTTLRVVAVQAHKVAYSDDLTYTVRVQAFLPPDETRVSE